MENIKPDNKPAMERYVLDAEKDFIQEHFEVESKSDSLYDASYNVFQNSAMPVIFGNRSIKTGIWSGSVSKGEVLTSGTLRETLNAKPCIIPASGFYMWKQTVKDPLPFYVRLLSRKVIGLAGYLDDEEGLEFHVITMESNVLLQPLEETMPCILEPHMYDGWLNGEALSILSSQFKSTALMPDLAVYRVPDLVNDPTQNSKELIQPIPKLREED